MLENARSAVIVEARNCNLESTVVFVVFSSSSTYSYIQYCRAREIRTLAQDLWRCSPWIRVAGERATWNIFIVSLNVHGDFISTETRITAAWFAVPVHLVCEALLDILAANETMSHHKEESSVAVVLIAVFEFGGGSYFFRRGADTSYKDDKATLLDSRSVASGSVSG